MKFRPIHLVLALCCLGLMALVALMPGCAESGKYAGLSKSPMSPEAQARQGVAMPPGAALTRNEELWVIERGSTQPQVAPDPQMPPSGMLLAKRSETEMVPVPLKHTDVKASIAGYIASVDVTQQFHNPYDTKIEAVYVFPLPHNAAINEFIMTIGDRKIRGIIREREEAQRIYDEAKRQGFAASLLTQERPNIFTQSVANIEPLKQIDVSIRYFHTLEYVDGWYEWVFPMVVGPRFNPPGSTDGVGAVARGGQGSSGQRTEVQYLKPTERSGHDIDVAVTINAGVRVEDMQCVNHQVSTSRLAGDVGAKVMLDDHDRIPNKDFVLRYKVAGKTVKSAAVVHRDEKRGGYFTLMMFPPASLDSLRRQPLELVFTLDTSGSMDGKPMEQSKAAMRYALSNMDSRDTFQVIRFGDRAEKMWREPRPVTRDNLNEAMSYIDRIKASGGTMLVDGLRASLDFPHDEGRLRFVTFLTDGFIGNETEALREINGRLGPARIFSFGVGSSTNRYLMDSMAKMGNGCAAYLSLNTQAEEVMAPFFRRIAHPAMTDLRLESSSQLREVYPQRLPDLFVGRPVIVTGRFDGAIPQSIRVRGRVAGQEQVIDVPVIQDEQPAQRALPALWARAKIADLSDRATWDPVNDLPQQIKSLALEYGLMSPFTAFVAVDSSRRTEGREGVTVPVPVPVPDGVKYETTVQEKPTIPAEK